MNIAKTIRLIRLSLLEMRSRRIERKKYRLTLKINDDFKSVDDEKLTQFNNVLEQLKGAFSVSYSGDDSYDE